MGLDFGLNLEQKQKLIMTPELRQAIQILQLSSFELSSLIEQELEKNPVIEIMDERNDEDSKVISEKQEDNNKEEIDWEQYFEHNEPYFKEPRFNREEQEYNHENFVKDTTTLQEHLLFQLHISMINPHYKKIGEYIIECIDNNGYLTMDPEEIASVLQENVLDVERILAFIQGFDPAGVGARDIKECLKIQLQQINRWNHTLEKIIGNYLEDLANNKFQLISKKLGLSFSEIQEVKDLIKSLEPKPGRAFASEWDIRYIVPDAYVEKIGEEYIVVMNDTITPRLQVSSFYKKMLREENRSSNTGKYLNEKLESAIWLIRSIEQRRNTLYNVVSAIVKIQQDFFDKGTNALKPLTLRDIAESLEIHESTVSRATNGKYVQTPRGLFELKYFFNSGIEKGNGDAVASEGIKNMIKNLINQEEPQKPISDQDIANALKARGISISRRTVAKYRDELGILSSSKRKRYN